MALYRTGLVVANVLQTHRLFDRALVGLGRARTPAGQALARRERLRVLRVYSDFNAEMELLAVRTSAEATLKIQQQLKRTAKRPDNRLKPHIRDHIVCRPANRTGLRIPTGEVGIADIEELNKVVNPLTPQFGPYWETQEEGYSGHVGRNIHGLFFGPGLSDGGDRPRAAFKGGSGPHPIFVAGPGGAGTIDEPIQARHFIENGTRATEKDWLAQLRAIERRTVAALRP